MLGMFYALILRFTLPKLDSEDNINTLLACHDVENYWGYLIRFACPCGYFVLSLERTVHITGYTIINIIYLDNEHC